MSKQTRQYLADVLIKLIYIENQNKVLIDIAAYKHSKMQLKCLFYKQ